MSNRFIPMECPVCHQYYFTDDTKIDKEVLGNNEKEDDYCPHCGWQYDLYQVEHPDVSGLTNKLSLNDYKKWFEQMIEENSDYDYTEYNYTEIPHICPVCGIFEFKDKSSFEVCPYCGWQDDELMENEPDSWGGCSNPLSLNDYKKDYQQKIKENPNYKWKNDPDRS